MAASDKTFRLPKTPLLIFLIATLVIAAGGWWLYRAEKAEALRLAEETLAAVADLKVKEIAAWRHERLRDAALLSANPYNALRLAPFLQRPPSGDAGADILDFMETIRRHYDYRSVLLVDNNHQVRLAAGLPSKEMCVVGKHEAAEVSRYLTPRFEDFHQCLDGKVVISLFAPIMGRQKAGDPPEIAGFLQLQIDPALYLYPLIQLWPTPSPTAETLLVRREGDELVFLNQLRHRRDPPLTLRFPLTDTQLPAAKAAMGKAGVTQGVDYRLEPVLAVLRPIPDSPWHLVAKVDLAEVMAPLRLHVLGIILTGAAILLGLGVTLMWWWKGREAAFYLAELQAAQERQVLVQHFDYLSRYANDIILLTDADLKFIEVNDRACEVYGYSREELLNLRVPDLRDPETLADLPGIIHRLDQEKGLVYETRQRRKDGGTFPVEISKRIIDTPGGRCYQAIIRDISDRQQALARLEGINQLKEDLLAAPGLTERLKRITDGVVDIFAADFARIWIVKPGDLCDSGCFHANNPEAAHLCRPRDYCLHLLASSGRYTHIDGVRRRRVPLGGCKIGLIAAGEDNKFLTNDVTHDPRIHDHQWASSLGLAAFAGYRIMSPEKKVLGVLALFSQHPITPEEDALLEGIANMAAQVVMIGEAEEALRASEEKYRSLFEHAVEGVFQSTPDGRFLSVNPAMARMLGYASPQEMMAEVADIGPQLWVYPEKRQEMMRLLAANRVLYDHEIQYRRRDGAVLWASANIRLANGPDGQDFYEGFMVDITRRKQAEQALQAERDRAQSYLDTAGIILVALNNKGEVTLINRKGCQILGYKAHELIGKNWFATCLSPVNGDSVAEVFKRLMAGDIEPVKYFENYVVTKGGELRLIAWYDTLVTDHDGSIVGTLSSGEDITERRRMEAEKQLHQERLDSLWRISQYNPETIQEVLDFALDQAISLTGSKIGYIYFYDDERRRFILNTWSKEVMQSCTIVEKQTVYDLDKTGIWGEAVRQARPIMVNDFQAPHPLKKGYPEGHAPLDKYLTIPVFSDGRIVAVVGIANKEKDYDDADVQQMTLLMDAVWKIVARRRAEEELRQLNLELEQRVRERTAQLEAANRELEAFSYSVSHDLRSPLRGIDGWSQALLEDCYEPLGENGRRYIDRVRWESQRMGRLIDDLLSLSRVGRAELTLEPVDLSALAQTIAARIKEDNPTRTVAWDIQPGLAAQGDARLLDLALFNLLDNAFKFTARRSQGRIEFGCLPNKGKPVYYVRDNGAGFDMAYAHKLFGAFQRLHKTSEYPGTGIGLATVQRVLHRHGGRIWAEAKPEEGATFFFTLA